MALGAACLLACMANARSITLQDISDKLVGTSCYADTCSYEVLLASLSEPVSYHVNIESTAAPGDSLAPCDYFVRWQMHTPNGTSEGFSAYFDGAHFRYRDKRLQEYHAEWNAEPFAPGGNTMRGVQNVAQFCDLIPQYIGTKFAEMAADSSYIYSIVEDNRWNGLKTVCVKGVRRISGFDCAEYMYVLDSETYLPKHIELENNPGQIGEQSIAINYGAENIATDCKIDLAYIMNAEGEAFEKYRESTFSLENLPGRPLPEIVAPTSTGERYFHGRGKDFAAPTLLVFLDSGVDSTPSVIEAVRSATSTLPMQLDVIWAFLDHRVDDVEAIIAHPEPGEHLLMHAGGAARDCGVGTQTPVLIFVGRDGTVGDFINGYNQELPSLVIEKASSIAQ